MHPVEESDVFWSDRFTGALAGVTMGVYALLLAGASTSLTDAATSCTTWPACEGQWFALNSPALVIIWGHRALAALLGVSVLLLTMIAWRRDERLRVRTALLVAVFLYPFQVALGAVTAMASVRIVGTAHLVTGITIFGALVLALTWHLEDVIPANASTSDRVTTESTNSPASLPFSGRLRTTVAYIRLMKPRLMWLLCLVAAAGMALAADGALSIETVVLTLGGGVLAIGASGTFNHVFERETDREMARTSDRPVVQELIPARNALAFGLLLTGLSLLVFLQVNRLAAVLGGTAILYYAVIYTLILKPNTVLNTVIGGVAGAIPALIGSAAVTGRIEWAGVGLAIVIFLWTPAHFYNLALAYKDDYERGGFPMVPVVYGDVITRKRIMLYLGATLIATAVLGWTTALGAVYAAATTILGAVFLWAVLRLHRDRDRSAAFRAFHASNAFLGTVLLAVVIDSLII